MDFSDDLPPPCVNDHVKRRSKKGRTIRTKHLEELISTAIRAAHVARDKGFYIVSPEAIQCVEILRHMRTLPLNARLISKTDGLRVLLFLSKNGLSLTPSLITGKVSSKEKFTNGREEIIHEDYVRRFTSSMDEYRLEIHEDFIINRRV
ncbi:transcription elongation factor (TFIIS) family protein [Arabidopsis thaliana]|uniref:Transcription elongation factor (TFIIS) family protein n=1 Tax=Arabidopsis thaliana TaxID=3702 RepID=F4J0L8_ARATH|nr:transcription elongation factor (TFIIS) family protein [Arabidopsis thaliana]AEE78660.1 transcription elongation factor (TFIIS) family protein [Arabidopsis thaliana]|eukprot:NP_680121.1 transcription elongation factor (TFIIS) family protein [Arabidopsis thaliana]